MIPEERNRAIDGLRGLAILSVIAWHYVFCGLPRNSEAPLVEALRSMLWLSWSGVHLFFVLSGYLIGRILLEVRGQPRYFRTFYARRALRILPLYAVVVVLALGLRAFEPARLAWLLGGSSPPWWAYATLLQTIWMVQHGFGMNALGVTWSLAIEEQFYVLAPIICRALSRVLLPVFLGVVVLTASVLRAWLVLRVDSKPLAAYLAMPCRADALALGMLAACALRSTTIRAFLERARGLLWVVAVGCASILVIGVVARHVRLNSVAMLTWGFSVLGIFYVMLLLLAVTRPSGALARALSWSPLPELGRLCFGLYLWHEIVLGVCHGLIFGRAPVLEDAEDAWITLLAFLLTLAMARASWKLVEAPLIRRSHGLQYGSP